jgi:hypothetical protein
MSRRGLRWVGVFVFTLYATFCVATVAYADTLSSTNYQFTDTDLGGGGLINSSSTNYQSVQSAGDNAVSSGTGASASLNYQIESGSQTTDAPGLIFSVTNPNANFSTFSATSTSTATSTFTVSDYTSYGYTVQIIGTPPKNGSHAITAMGTTASPSVGTEQFGLNLVANTVPISFGANPNQGQFGHGVAATNYNTANKFRYVSGETIASSPKSSGATIFTLSYIVNVSDTTPGGQYSSNQTIVCTGTY